MFYDTSNWRVTFFTGLMSKEKFQKPATTVDEQIDILKSRGMLFKDEQFAKHILLHTNYYRLTAYWLPFEKTHKPHLFMNGTSFEQVINFYNFYKKLRC